MNYFKKMFGGVSTVLGVVEKTNEKEIVIHDKVNNYLMSLKKTDATRFEIERHKKYSELVELSNV